jgi:hypothetical protein
MNDLKPCPACSKAALINEAVCYIYCSNTLCAVMGPTYDPDGSKWNALPRHSDNAALVAENERLRGLSQPAPHSHSQQERGR